MPPVEPEQCTKLIEEIQFTVRDEATKKRREEIQRFDANARQINDFLSPANLSEGFIDVKKGIEELNYMRQDEDGVRHIRRPYLLIGIFKVLEDGKTTTFPIVRPCLECINSKNQGSSYVFLGDSGDSYEITPNLNGKLHLSNESLNTQFRAFSLQEDSLPVELVPEERPLVPYSRSQLHLYISNFTQDEPGIIFHSPDGIPCISMPSLTLLPLHVFSIFQEEMEQYRVSDKDENLADYQFEKSVEQMAKFVACLGSEQSNGIQAQ